MMLRITGGASAHFTMGAAKRVVFSAGCRS
jgi:hypothetical protein